MRQASAAPRNSHELAVRNQFFTPRYVVEFLTDNTLGRIWYEMRKGETELKEKCRYLVRRPTEIFLNNSEEQLEQESNDSELCQEELLRQPVYIPRRPKKDPREIRMLDPAGGSGHFGLYAFDLFEVIYQEAYDDPELGPLLQIDYPDREQFIRETPRLILMNNIHIIDIDPRAVQIAALALWLRAQKSYNELKLKPAERPRITRTNVVCAEPMPGEIDLLKEFTASLTPRLLGQIVEIIFDRMKLAGEAGTLLKIEEEIQDAIVKAKDQWLQGSKKEQGELFPEVKQIEPIQGLLFDLSDITDEEFWEHAEDKILDALEAYAEQTEGGRALSRRLFAEDTAKGFAFIDLCRKRYDVVLMNPPFGQPSFSTANIVKRDYQDAGGDLYPAFILRGLTLCDRFAMQGAIVSRTFLHLVAFRRLREMLLKSPNDFLLRYIVEMGIGVLDGATVRPALSVMVKGYHGYEDIIAIGLRNSESYESDLHQEIRMLSIAKIGNKTWIQSPSFFSNFPGMIIAYWVPRAIAKFFEKADSLGKESPDLKGNPFASVKVGLTTGDDFRFVRLGSEINPRKIGLGNTWQRFLKGGEFRPIENPSYLLVNWKNNGKYLKAFNGSFFRNETSYGKRGIVCPYISDKGIGAQPCPEGHIFGHASRFIENVRGNFNDLIAMLLILNTTTYNSFLACLTADRKHESGILASLPVAKIAEKNIEELAELGRKCVIAFHTRQKQDENSPLFLSSLLFLKQNMKLYDLYLFTENKKKEIRKFASDNISYAEKILWTSSYIDSNLWKGFISLAADFRASESSNYRKHVKENPEDSFEEGDDVSLVGTANAVIAYIIGVCLGRWDIRITLDPSLAPSLTDPFDSLPVCPPGTLVDPDCLPANPGDIVSEEWLRKRAGGGMNYEDGKWVIPEGDDSLPTARCTLPLDSAYPIRISWPGILVDDENHAEDIIRRVREVLDVLWGERSESIEQEACSILGVKSLRDYFRSPSDFFQDHLKRYSKSRRKAPIYWPLSTTSGSYTLWVYCHRLTDQTLYLGITDYVNPKLDDTRKDIERLQTEIAKGGTASQRNDLEKLIDFEHELKDLRDELLRVAKLPYEPNLNDGVMITSAPLWKLFRHTSWRKDLEDCWKKLEAGDYDWAHMAYSIWPERVKEKCKIDKSIAIAHDLEHIYEEKTDELKKKKKSKKK